MRKSIGIDLDDTLNTLVRDWLKVYNLRYDDKLQPEDIKGWDIGSYVKPGLKDTFFNILNEPDFIPSLGIQPRAAEVTKWLSSHCDLFIVAAYLDIIQCPGKILWISKNLPYIDIRHNVMFVNDKSKICTDYLIDDGMHNFEKFKGKPILFDKPWNQTATEYLRVHNWDDIEAYFGDEL